MSTTVPDRVAAIIAGALEAPGCPQRCPDNDHYLTLRQPDGCMAWVVHIEPAVIIGLGQLDPHEQGRGYRLLAHANIATQLRPGLAYCYVMTPPAAAKVNAPSLVRSDDTDRHPGRPVLRPAPSATLRGAGYFRTCPDCSYFLAQWGSLPPGPGVVHVCRDDDGAPQLIVWT